MSTKLIVLDKTLTEGEQASGIRLGLSDKLRMAEGLVSLKIDIIEAGFPGFSENEFKVVKAISKEIGKYSMICALSRPNRNDIDAAYSSMRQCANPLINIIIDSYESFKEDKKSNKSKEQLLDAISYAKAILPKVQCTLDYTIHTEFHDLLKMSIALVKAGADIINIRDNFGCAIPEPYGEMLGKLNERIKQLNPDGMLSVHNHNDMGLAAANTLSAVKNGVQKIECSINGIGERAGNTSLEEVVMALKLNKGYYKASTNVAAGEIKKTSKLVNYLMNFDLQVNKPITGDNVFSNSYDLYQNETSKWNSSDGVIRPSDVGAEEAEVVLTASSGAKQLKNELSKIGFSKFSDKEFENIFYKFTELAKKKKEIYRYDLYYIIEKTIDIDSEHVDEFIEAKNKLYELLDLEVVSNIIVSSAKVKLRRGEEVFSSRSFGNGAVDALYTAIKDIVDINIELKDYKISSISRGKEALGKVIIQVSHNNKSYTSKAIDTDIIKASALALINAVNTINVYEAKE